MSKLQSDEYERGYFHKIWMEYYCLDKNHTSGTLSSRFIRCQNPYQLQNFVHLSGAQKPTCAKYLEFDFLYLERQGYIDISYINFKIHFQNFIMGAQNSKTRGKSTKYKPIYATIVV